ncbi:MAG: hypothetical protein HY791_29865 [Deltaproteobacteria bacterium]|nr:hypothetical protein [Deltaproteobacteria bacterium]
MEYKYSQRAGVLNEAAPEPRAARQKAGPDLDRTTAMVTSLASVHAQSIAPESPRPRDELIARVAAARAAGAGLDPIRGQGDKGMFFFTVEEGARVRVIEKDGRVRVVGGPSRIWRMGRRIEPMTHYVAHPGEFLIVRFRDGKQRHLVAPADLWFDPREHAEVRKEDALQIASKEAVVAYSRGPTGQVSRRVIYGPTAFVPEPGEWLHTFSWHGSRGGEDGYLKVPNALVFQKLWSLPDQMYHDIQDVRTSDDAVLTIRLMIFFELVGVEKMLDSTHDPIGDFVNAATSDVVELVGKYDFESFKQHTDRLNQIETYQQLTSRADQCGYRINKVVYRGYGAPESLQRMHDEAIETRTRLALERATQHQAQDLEDAKLERDLTRAARLRSEQEAKLLHEIGQATKRQEAQLRDESIRSDFSRTQSKLDEEQRGSLARARDQEQLVHFTALRTLGVDLTALLTQGRADRIIEVRGNAQPHVHLGSDTATRE